MIGSEHHFRQSLGPDRAQFLSSSLEQAASQARQDAVNNTFVEARTEPVLAFDYAVQRLGDNEGPFASTDGGVTYAWASGQHFWIVEKLYALRVKKLRSGYQYSNHTSGQQERISQQRQLDGMSPSIYITIGNVYSDHTGLVTERVAVKYRQGTTRLQEPEWIVDLDELAAGGVDPARPILPMPNMPSPDLQPQVRVRGKRVEERRLKE